MARCNSVHKLSKVAAAMSLIGLSACSNVEFGAGANKGIECPAGSSDCANATFRTVEEEVKVTQTNKVDILFVIDSSKSMEREQARLGQRLNTFVSRLSNLDWQICVTTTYSTRDKGQPLLFSDGTKVLGPSTPNASSLFEERLTTIPMGGGDEQGIRSMNLAIADLDKDCYRSDAALAAVVISDEDERSTGGHEMYRDERQFIELEPENYPANLVSNVSRLLGPQKIFTAHSIVIQSGDLSCYNEQANDSEVFFGTRYEELSELTGGIIGNVCADDYSQQLEDFAGRIKSTLSSVNLKCTPLEEPQVTISPRPADVTVSTVGNKITFTPALPSGTTVSLRYRCSL